MKIPSKEECLKLFDRYKVPDNILLHSKKVKEVSLFLAEKLIEKGAEIDLELVESGALLHDLMKAVVLEKLAVDEKFKLKEVTREQIEMWQELKKKYAGKHETEATYDILKDDYPEFAIFIRDIGVIRDNLENVSWEEKIVHYADWRVFVDDIVSLQERLEDLHNRYHGKSTKDQEITWDAKSKVQFTSEKEIFDMIGMKPEELGERLK